MTYEGYTGLIVEVDEDDGELYGRVVGLARDGITFGGKTVEEARRSFHESVDAYLEWSSREGFEPERPDPAAAAAALAAAEENAEAAASW